MTKIKLEGIRKMKHDLPTRKNIRLKNYDYSAPGAYFVTICTDKRKEILSQVIMDNKGNGAENKLSDIGFVCDDVINHINNAYGCVTVDKYVIMPNHIHLLLSIHDTNGETCNIVNIIKAMKLFVTRKIGKSIWQRSFYDHIIRDKSDYENVWKYIDTNVLKWGFDSLNCNGMAGR